MSLAIYRLHLAAEWNVAADCCHELTFCTTENSALKSSSVADCTARYSGLARATLPFISSPIQEIQFPKSVASVPEWL
jgi:uncharacterized protein (UPF0261 family)